MATARTRANDKYNKKAYDRFLVTVPKGKKSRIQMHAECMGESLNGFINRAIDKQIKRDDNVPDDE